MPEEHSITAIENTAGNSAMLFLANQRLFGLLLYPINSLFLRPFHPHCSVCPMCAIVIGIPLAYLRFGSFIFP